MKTTLIALLIASSTASLAGDLSQTQFLGFSPDGSAVGFQQSGIQDGSGFPYCKVTLVDTKNNRYIVSPSEVYIETEGATSPRVACQKAQAKIKSVLAKLKLDPDRGTRHFSRLATDEGGPHAKSVQFGTSMITPLQSEYTVSITETETGSENDYQIRPSLLKLVLSSPKGEQVLQNDSVLPTSRQWAYAYELEEGYSYEVGNVKAFAFTVRYSTPGFEGPDLRTMVVTGMSQL